MPQGDSAMISHSMYEWHKAEKKNYTNRKFRTSSVVCICFVLLLAMYSHHNYIA